MLSPRCDLHILVLSYTAGSPAVEEMSLFLNGEYLEDAKLMTQYALSDGSLIHVSLRFTTTLNLRCKLPDLKYLKLEMKFNDSVLNLKWMLFYCQSTVSFMLTFIIIIINLVWW